MAGIYIHIPFCKKKCYYCDFFSIASSSRKIEYIESLIKEINLRKEYLADDIIKSIYFGGGTPSLLEIDELNRILNQIENYFKLSENCEITIEVNPEDINEEYIELLSDTKVNRISIGIQSLNDNILKFLGRRHNSQKAYEVVRLFQKAGFINISIDLIYGIPGLSIKQLTDTLDKIIELNLMHISTYHLTIEPKTVLYKKLTDNKINIISEEESLWQYNIIKEKFRKYDYEQYEISNFAKNNLFSIHNVGYWTQQKYLGIGASAHSYDGNSRQWNVSDVKKYIESLNKGNIACEIEYLSNNDKYNEYIMTRLRTKWGINLEEIEQLFGNDLYKYFIDNSRKFIENNDLYQNHENILITEKSLYISDYIISNLMI
jgi:oxygen-independent coproporphyrinogen-3 oxidase